MKLYGYWRSSATYRVRIALGLKDLAYDYEPVNLLKDEQKSERYRALSPQGLVPVLITDDGAALTQSMAIIEYLEERYPETPLLPEDEHARARARAIAATIACEAQPFMNLRIQKYLREKLNLDDALMAEWLNLWAGGAMASVEQMITETSGRFCIGDAPSIADAFLIPQVYAARRFEIDLSAMPRINAVADACARLDAFIAAEPHNQPDAPKP